MIAVLSCALDIGLFLFFHLNGFSVYESSVSARFIAAPFNFFMNKVNQVSIEGPGFINITLKNEFITQSLPCNLIGMNSILMTEYIKFVADRLMSQFGFTKIYNVENPFDFMELISMRKKTNFFEKRVAEYNKAGVGVDDNSMKLDLECDF